MSGNALYDLHLALAAYHADPLNLDRLKVLADAWVRAAFSAASRQQPLVAAECARKAGRIVGYLAS